MLEVKKDAFRVTNFHQFWLVHVKYGRYSRN